MGRGDVKAPGKRAAGAKLIWSLLDNGCEECENVQKLFFFVFPLSRCLIVYNARYSFPSAKQNRCFALFLMVKFTPVGPSHAYRHTLCVEIFLFVNIKKVKAVRVYIVKGKRITYLLTAFFRLKSNTSIWLVAGSQRDLELLSLQGVCNNRRCRSRRYNSIMRCRFFFPRFFSSSVISLSGDRALRYLLPQRTTTTTRAACRRGRGACNSSGVRGGGQQLDAWNCRRAASRAPPASIGNCSKNWLPYRQYTILPARANISIHSPGVYSVYA